MIHKDKTKWSEPKKLLQSRPIIADYKSDCYVSAEYISHSPLQQKRCLYSVEYI